MRHLALLVLLAPTIVAASPHETIWGGVAIGMGPPPVPHGELADRTERSHCGDGTCQLGGRMGFGGGVGRWSGELELAVIPVNDTTPMTGGSRVALMIGPQARYSAFRKWGFDLSVRLGVELGSFERDVPRTETHCTGGDPPKCSTDKIDDGYSAVGASGGVSLAWRVRFDRGYFALQADLDASWLSTEYPDGSVTGFVTGKTFGIAFGSMFEAD